MRNCRFVVLSGVCLGVLSVWVQIQIKVWSHVTVLLRRLVFMDCNQVINSAKTQIQDSNNLFFPLLLLNWMSLYLRTLSFTVFFLLFHSFCSR